MSSTQKDIEAARENLTISLHTTTLLPDPWVSCS